MPDNLKKWLLWSLILTLFLSVAPQSTFAQTAPAASNATSGEATLGVARIVAYKDLKVKNGSILSSTDKGAVLSSIPYDSQVIGIVSRDAAIILAPNGDNGVPVISVGNVYILVSAKEGVIKKGDLITTSTTPGVAAKALKSGYVLGTALEDYSDTRNVGLIAIDLNLHYYNSKSTLAGTLSDILKLAVLPTKEAPTPLFKYIVAAIVVLGSFALGFVSFGRTAAKGVEALGRNPAASKIIHLGIIFNVSIVVVIVGTGLIVAFLILRL